MKIKTCINKTLNRDFPWMLACVAEDEGVTKDEMRIESISIRVNSTYRTRQEARNSAKEFKKTFLTF